MNRSSRLVGPALVPALALAILLSSCGDDEPADLAPIPDEDAVENMDAEEVAAAPALTDTPVKEEATVELTQLLGRWVSDTDPQSVVILREEDSGDFTWIDRYDDDEVGEFPLRFVENCENRRLTGEIEEAFVTGTGADEMCYSLLDVSPESLELSVAERGNTLLYSRAE